MKPSAGIVGIRFIAGVEAAKALLVLLAGFGLLTLIHGDVEAAAAHVVRRLHLNAANRYPQIFLHAASRATDTHLWILASLALVYAVARLIEAYGLWFDRRWAEWFALVSAAIYLPFEVYELCHNLNAASVAALVINLIIVSFIGWRLRQSTVRHETSYAYAQTGDNQHANDPA